MGNTQCSCCSHPTNITNYWCKYKKNICNDCINYIQRCAHCNQWYTKNLLRYNEKLYCIDCVNNFNEILFTMPSYPCNMCDKKYTTNMITYENKLYCIHCVEKISDMYKFVNKKLK